MTCHETRTWLLTSRADAGLPAPLRRHLKQCPACRRRRRRLRQLDRRVVQAPIAPPQRSSRVQLQQKLDELRRGSAPARPSRPLPPCTSRLVAAVVLLAAGLAVLSRVGWQEVRPPLSRPPVAQMVPAADSLPDRLIERDLRLANAASPAERFQLLADLSDDLRSEAFRLAREGRTEELRLTAELYGQVVRFGLLAQAAKLPPAERLPLVASVQKRLRATEQEADQLAQGMLPYLAEPVRALRTAAQEAQQVLEAPPAVEPNRPPPPRPAPTLVAVLVHHGLKLAAEDDLLRRAEYCTDVADQLVDSILTATAAGDVDQAGQLGERLGQVIERGVAPNLGRAFPADLHDPRVQQWDEVVARVGRALDVLQRNLDQAPAPARAGLERALNAPQFARWKHLENEWKRVPPGHSRARLPKGKGKGPPGVKGKAHAPGQQRP
jgi:hypothetical protein